MQRLDEAILVAVEAHSGQRRKMDFIPYIFHPCEVANIIATITDDEDVIIAGLLHDTLEDSFLTKDEIATKFGERVLRLVLAETENKRNDRPREQTWAVRKEESLTELENSKDRDVYIIWLADKLSNLRSYYRDYLKEKDKLWDNFNQKDPLMHKWYYQRIMDITRELRDSAAYKEYQYLFSKIFD